MTEKMGSQPYEELRFPELDQLVAVISFAIAGSGNPHVIIKETSGVVAKKVSEPLASRCVSAFSDSLSSRIKIGDSEAKIRQKVHEAYLSVEKKHSKHVFEIVKLFADAFLESDPQTQTYIPFEVLILEIYRLFGARAAGCDTVGDLPITAVNPGDYTMEAFHADMFVQVRDVLRGCMGNDFNSSKLSDEKRAEFVSLLRNDYGHENTAATYTSVNVVPRDGNKKKKKRKK